MNPDAIKGYPGEIMQCTERFTSFTYTTYFADTGFGKQDNYNHLFSTVSKKI